MLCLLRTSPGRPQSEACDRYQALNGIRQVLLAPGKFTLPVQAQHFRDSGLSEGMSEWRSVSVIDSRQGGSGTNVLEIHPDECPRRASVTG